MEHFRRQINNIHSLYGFFYQAKEFLSFFLVSFFEKKNTFGEICSFWLWTLFFCICKTSKLCLSTWW